MDRIMSEMRGIDPCEGGHDLGLLSSSEERQSNNTGKQIFCNSAVNMKNIVVIGYDMDYTLAQYKPDSFESLAYNGTVEKLVRNFGYPEELLDWSFDWTYMVRGIVLDKKRGNMLKMDKHKYVKVAYHGFRLISKNEKVATYGNTFIKDAFDGPDYAHIDTLFSLAEAYLFAQLVEYKDSNPTKISEAKDYARIYADVGSAVDMCHRDGTLKEMVAKDPKKYINEDNSIIPMLKNSGRAIFLVTNSLWDYTNVVMNFLFGASTMGDSSSLSFDWLQYFDFVITGSAKPNFFHDDNHANLFAVELESGKLVNTDNGTPLAQVGSPAIELPDQIPNQCCKVFQVQRLHIRAAHQEAQRSFHEKFHLMWGQLMKTGYQNSRFAHQVERFACLYTSQVGNLGLYSPNKYYRPGENFMAHESNVLSL